MFKRFFVLFSAVVLTLSIAVTCSEDNGLGPVFFDPPASYMGTYLATFDWMTGDSSSGMCTAEFEFNTQGSFLMRVEDTGKAGNFNICSVQGIWTFNGDSLFITVTNDNLNQDVCRPDAKPQADFRYMIDGDYIVFESRDTNPYRKIEIYGR